MGATTTPIEDLRASAALYALLSRLFLKEPTPAEIVALRRGEQGRRLREMGYDLLAGLDALSEEEWMTGRVEGCMNGAQSTIHPSTLASIHPSIHPLVHASKQAEAIAVEYCRLFIGPGPHLSPHEAIVRGEQRHWGDSTVAVNAAYQAAGLQLAPEVREMPDHVGVELLFVGTLCEEEADHAARGARGDAARVRDVRRQFLIEHLGVWLPMLAREVAARTTLAFYETLARLAADWVESDMAGLRAGARRGEQ